MERVSGIRSLSRALKHPVVTIGNFDGVHLGHRKIVETAIARAREKGGDCVAYTFRPHPQLLLRPELQTQLLTTYEEKLDLLEALGVDVVIEEPFSREFSEKEPSEFFSDILLHQLSVEAIVVGYDFAFGRERHGHLDSLRQFCSNSGVELHVVPPQRVAGSGHPQTVQETDGDVVSSSKIRQYLKAGQLPEANRLLGRAFSYRGIVVKGEGRGRKIGFPTANLSTESKMALPLGVYATRAIVEKNAYLSVTNIGVRPTFQVAGQSDGVSHAVHVETHLLDMTMDLYGQTLEIQFIERLRDERKFFGIEELKTQIALDLAQAKKILK